MPLAVEAIVFTSTCLDGAAGAVGAVSIRWPLTDRVVVVGVGTRKDAGDGGDHVAGLVAEDRDGAARASPAISSPY